VSAPSSVAEVLATIDVARAFPVYDPQHQDEEIVGAWEKVRSWRNWLICEADSKDRVSSEWAREDEDRLDDEHRQLEAQVRENWATTPAGVAAQLSLAVIDVDQTALLEGRIVSLGLRAAFLQKDGMDGGIQQIIQAAYSLQCLDWYQALADYDRSKPLCKLAHEMFNAFDNLRRKQPALADDLAHLHDLVSATEKAASNHTLVERLMKTLVVEPDELQRKIEILIDENMIEDGLPWLLRDVAYLTINKEA
jgi:hypothetical protein